MIKGETYTVHIGSNLDILPTLEDNSIDSIVTDPPYELGFMGKKWDSSGIAYSVELWKECLRVLKPGGHLLAFSGSRTYHRMVVAIEDSGFEIRDMISWISNKTFPKSHNIEKSTQSNDWKGWGTALKPTVEPIVMARKPLIGTVAENVLTYGTGGLNIDGSRIGTTEETARKPSPVSKDSPAGMGHSPAMGGNGSSLGRWPANVILDPYTAELLDEQSGITKSGKSGIRTSDGFNANAYGKGMGIKAGQDNGEYGDKGGASRFFYVARASKRDRNEGLEKLPAVYAHKGHYLGDLQDSRSQNFHPTVKPTDLMRYLVKLVTRPGGTVLDPFTGSGSTGKAAILEGFEFVGIELTEDYIPIIEGRLKHAQETVNNKEEGLF